MDTNRITNAEQDVGKLIQGAFNDLEKLATQHIKLFKSDLKEDLSKTTQGILSMIVGMNILFIGGVMLAATLALGLVEAFNLASWAAFGIVGVLVAVGGGVFLGVAVQRFESAAPIAEKTREELEEDAKWLKNPK